MIANLSDWYRKAKIDNLSPSLISDRIKSLNKIIESQVLDWFLDCVRTVFNKKNKSDDFITSFGAAFKEFDPTFDSENKFEVRILSAAIASEVIKIDSELSLTIAYSSCCGAFGNGNSDFIASALVDHARKFLHDKAISERDYTIVEDSQISFPAFNPGDTIEPINNFLKTFVPEFEKFTKSCVLNETSLKDRISTLEEESNVHWYIFREYSSYEKLPIKSLDPQGAPFLIALELFDLTNFYVGLHNADIFLKKILNEIPGLTGKDITLQESVENFVSKYGKHYKSSDLNNYDDLNPLQLAIEKYQETGGDQSWVNLFQRATGVDVNFKMKPFEMALQFYNEYGLNRS